MSTVWVLSWLKTTLMSAPISAKKAVYEAVSAAVAMILLIALSVFSLKPLLPPRRRIERNKVPVMVQSTAALSHIHVPIILL